MGLGERGLAAFVVGRLLATGPRGHRPRPAAPRPLRGGVRPLEDGDRAHLRAPAGGENRGSTLPAPRHPRPRGRRRILVADDSSPTARGKTILEEAGYEVQPGADGQACDTQTGDRHGGGRLRMTGMDVVPSRHRCAIVGTWGGSVVWSRCYTGKGAGAGLRWAPTYIVKERLRPRRPSSGGQLRKGIRSSSWTTRHLAPPLVGDPKAGKGRSLGKASDGVEAWPGEAPSPDNVNMDCTCQARRLRGHQAHHVEPRGPPITTSVDARPCRSARAVRLALSP